MLTIIEGLPDHVIGIRINDKLRAEDYERQLIPLVNEKLKHHHKLDLHAPANCLGLRKAILVRQRDKYGDEIEAHLARCVFI